MFFARRLQASFISHHGDLGMLALKPRCPLSSSFRSNTVYPCPMDLDTTLHS